MTPCVHICTFFNADGTIHSQSVNATMVPNEAGAKMLDGIYRRALNETLQRGPTEGNPKTCQAVRCAAVKPVEDRSPWIVPDGEALGVDRLSNLSSDDVHKVQQNLLLEWFKFNMKAQGGVFA